MDPTVTPVSLATLALSAGALLLVALAALRRLGRHHLVLRRAALACFTTLFLAIGVEAACRAFYVQSDGWNFTQASYRWHQKYWHPVNSLGYRDIEHPLTPYAGGRTVFVVGDSLVAGHGVARSADRFVDLVRGRLGEEWRVVMVARSGMDTPQEYEALTAYPYVPDRVVLCYYINDINRAVTRKGEVSEPATPRVPTGALRTLLTHSYALNTLYWRVYRAAGEEFARSGLAAYRERFASPTVWATHEQQLLQFVQWAEANRVTLSVVVFPMLEAISESQEIMAKVPALFRSHHIQVIELADFFSSAPPGALIVNPFDPHPNEQAHRWTAEILLSRLFGRPS